MGPLIPLAIQGGMSLFGSLFGAKKQTDAANRAAELQSRDNAAQLAFLRQQAQNAYANSEVNRRGNYDQWAAGERRKAALWKARGWGDREIPAYVPGVNPQFTAGSVGSFLPPIDARDAFNQRADAARNRQPLPGSVGSYLRY